MIIIPHVGLYDYVCTLYVLSYYGSLILIIMHTTLSIIIYLPKFASNKL